MWSQPSLVWISSVYSTVSVLPGDSPLLYIFLYSHRFCTSFSVLGCMQYSHCLGTSWPVFQVSECTSLISFIILYWGSLHVTWDLFIWIHAEMLHLIEVVLRTSITTNIQSWWYFMVWKSTRFERDKMRQWSDVQEVLSYQWSYSRAVFWFLLFWFNHQLSVSSRCRVKVLHWYCFKK